MRVRAGCEQILVATVDNSFKLQSNYHKHRGYDIGIARGEIRVNLINAGARDETREAETSLQNEQCQAAQVERTDMGGRYNGADEQGIDR